MAKNRGDALSILQQAPKQIHGLTKQLDRLSDKKDNVTNQLNSTMREILSITVPRNELVIDRKKYQTLEKHYDAPIKAIITTSDSVSMLMYNSGWILTGNTHKLVNPLGGEIPLHTCHHKFNRGDVQLFVDDRTILSTSNISNYTIQPSVLNKVTHFIDCSSVVKNIDGTHTYTSYLLFDNIDYTIGEYKLLYNGDTNKLTYVCNTTIECDTVGMFGISIPAVRGDDMLEITYNGEIKRFDVSVINDYLNDNIPSVKEILEKQTFLHNKNKTTQGVVDRYIEAFNLHTPAISYVCDPIKDTVECVPIVDALTYGRSKDIGILKRTDGCMEVYDSIFPEDGTEYGCTVTGYTFNYKPLNKDNMSKLLKVFNEDGLSQLTSIDKHNVVTSHVLDNGCTTIREMIKAEVTRLQKTAESELSKIDKQIELLIENISIAHDRSTDIAKLELDNRKHIATINMENRKIDSSTTIGVGKNIVDSKKISSEYLKAKIDKQTTLKTHKITESNNLKINRSKDKVEKIKNITERKKYKQSHNVEKQKIELGYFSEKQKVAIHKDNYNLAKKTLKKTRKHEKRVQKHIESEAKFNRKLKDKESRANVAKAGISIMTSVLDFTNKYRLMR